MAHPDQILFIQKISRHLADGYSGKRILEIGSYDVNGSIRSCFKKSTYTGVDLIEGPNVDVVCEGGKVSDPDETYDITVSCECFEHNPQWLETFLNMYRMTKRGGIVTFTCATTGRFEHGTARTLSESSPGTQAIGWDYYLNLREKDFTSRLSIDRLFDAHFFLTNKYHRDLFFVGLKSGKEQIFNFDGQKLKRECATAVEELQRNIDLQSRDNKLLRLLRRISLVPIQIAMLMPDKQYQNFVFFYYKLTGRARELINRFFKYRH